MSFFPDSPLPPDAPAASKLQELYGFVPRLFRLLSPFPEFVEQQALLLDTLLNNEEFLTRVQKERILLAASSSIGGPYGAALHEQMLRLLGDSETEIARIAAGEPLSSADEAMLAFARRAVTDPQHLREEDLQSLQQSGLREPQIVEVVVLIGLCKLQSVIHRGTGATPDFATQLVKQGGGGPQNNLYPPSSEPRPTTDTEESEPAEAPEDPDRDWVQRVQSGDVEAFEALVTRHSQRVYRTLVALLGNPDEAKDAVQETFLKAFQNLPRFEGRAKFSTWLVSIASNTGVQKLRERKQFESLDEDPTSEEFRPRQLRSWGDDPEQSYSKSEQRALVEQAIARLPAKYRVVLLLRDVQQVPTEEAAAALGLGVPALKARLLRGRLMLREALAPHFAQGAQTA